MITVRSSIDSIRVGGRVQIEASGGTEPYSFAVAANGVGGSINTLTGVYTAPFSIPETATSTIETIIVSDAAGLRSTHKLNILMLEEVIASILKRELSLAPDQIFLYNQKHTYPNDSRLYITILALDSKVFGNTSVMDHSDVGLSEIQSLMVKQMISIDLHSRSLAAIQQKELVVLALNSSYSHQRQEMNSIGIAKIPINFTNLSEIEGASIPYRFNFSFAIQYSKSIIKPVDYFDTFDTPLLNIES